MLEEERQAYGMSAEQIGQVLREIVLPHIGPSTSRIEVTRDEQGAIATKDMLTPSGQRTQLAASGMSLKEGSKSPVLLGMAILSASLAEDQPGRGAEHKLLCQREFILKNRRQLEGLGMKGIYRSPDEGLMNWDQWLARCEDGIARTRSAAREATETGN